MYRMTSNVFSRSIDQMRRRRGVALAVGAIVLALLVGGGVFAMQTFSGTDEVRRGLEAAVSNATQTATPALIATSTPAPAPIAPPDSLPDTRGGIPGPHAPGLAFPPPPLRLGPVPANEYGIARITAPTLGVDHYIEILGVTNGQMDSPKDGSYAVGYYPDFSQVPGESGNAIFSAHETWNHLQGPFYQMHKAKPGDEIFVEMTDGRRLRYRVMTSTRYDIGSIPMAEIVWPSKRHFGEQWLTLITCGGRIVYDSTGFGEYLDRDVTIAKLVP
jgi:hypothetical protein